MLVTEKQFIDTVYRESIGKKPSETPSVSGISQEDYNCLFDIKSDPTVIEQISAIIFDGAINSCDVGNKTRYKFPLASKREEFLKIVFERSYENNPNDIIQLAEKLADKSFYPTWKKVCLITIPQFCSATFQSTPFMIGSIALATIFGILQLNTHYNTVSHVISDELIPFFVNHLPSTVIREGTNAFIDLISFVARRYISIFVACCIVKYFVARFDSPYLANLANTINLLSIGKILFYVPAVTFYFLCHTGISCGRFFYTQCNAISYISQAIEQKAERERLTISKKGSYEVWKKIVAQNAPGSSQ